jgi:predicted AlkP superfamily phosphohydrolase/phosphomutase
MRRPVLLIGLDAAEITLVDRLCDEGRLPTLRALREKGCQGRLRCDASLFAGGVWPTFYTSKSVPRHGVYHQIQWRPERTWFELIGEDWLPERPFWEQLDPSDYRVAILDVPLVVGHPRAANGMQLSGWGTHDALVVGSAPQDLWARLHRRYGPPPMHEMPVYGRAALFLASDDAARRPSPSCFASGTCCCRPLSRWGAWPRTCWPPRPSGNHTDRGWFVALGEGIPPRARANDGDIRDLAPTVLRWLGATPPSDYMGRAIPELLRDDAL